MKKEERLKALEQKLKESPQPLSGDKLAKSLHVSRQVIVQDIALLRALNMPIISTNRERYLAQSGIFDGGQGQSYDGADAAGA